MSKRGNRLVWVELDQYGQAVAIPRNPFSGAVGDLGKWPRAKAVAAIRQAVYQRSDGECERCGRPITWKTMQLHERMPKSLGGEVSLSNCWALCHGCHQERPDSEHGNRRWGGLKSANQPVSGSRSEESGGADCPVAGEAEITKINHD